MSIEEQKEKIQKQYTEVAAKLGDAFYVVETCKQKMSELQAQFVKICEAEALLKQEKKPEQTEQTEA